MGKASVQLLSLEGPLFPLSSRPERSEVERSLCGFSFLEVFFFAEHQRGAACAGPTTHLVQKRGFFPVKVAAQDGFDDQMIGGGGGAYTYSDVDFPLGRNVQIRHCEDLLLLIM